MIGRLLRWLGVADPCCHGHVWEHPLKLAAWICTPTVPHVPMRATHRLVLY